MIADIDNIKDLYFDGTAAQRGYLGGTLVYERPPQYGADHFVGRMAGAGQTVFMINTDSGNNGYYVTDANGYFDIEVDTSTATYLYLYYLRGSRIGEIYHLPDFSSLEPNGLFDNETELTSVDFSGTRLSEPEDASSMFSNCRSLKSVDLRPWDLSNVTDSDDMFYCCTSLKTIKFKRLLQLSGPNALYLCTSLTDIDGRVDNISAVYLDCSLNPLTNTSAMTLINAYWRTYQPTLKLSYETYQSLTQAQIATATSKGLTLTSGY